MCVITDPRRLKGLNCFTCASKFGLNQWMKMVVTRFFIHKRDSLIETVSKKPPYEQYDNDVLVDTAQDVEQKIDVALMLAMMENQRHVDVLRHLILLDEKPEKYAESNDVTVDNLYINPTTGIERFVDGGDFLSAWKASGHYMISASKTANGYNPQPIDVEDIDLDANLEELTETIAENAHDIWARARIVEGWTYSPVRNDELKQHPDLVPYSQLPDSEKEHNRIMAMNTLRFVLCLVFDIINRNKI